MTRRDYLAELDAEPRDFSGFAYLAYLGLFAVGLVAAVRVLVPVSVVVLGEW